MTAIGIVLFPRFTQLDAMGPFEVLARLPGAQVHLVASTGDPVVSDTGLTVVPSVTFEACPALDVLCVPGGPGQVDHMTDGPLLDFLRRQGEGARFVTSVCTGSLLLAAAGLLDGYRATSHWSVRDHLAWFGAEPTEARVVRDRNRITGGGVTAGIDFAFTLAAELAGPEVAQGLQLGLEYDPQPPYSSGTPATAPREVLEMVTAMRAERMARTAEVHRAVAEQLRARETPAP
ncbi:MAG: DJ-1/PfpI family protein [Myxococcota bacterium]